MIRTAAHCIPIAFVLALWACAAKPTKPDSEMASNRTDAKNPLLAPWSGPWGGIPPFGQFKVADIKPALETAMDENLAEIDRIAADPAPATFENTIAAMERSGHALDRVATIYAIYTGTMNDAEVQVIESEMEPKLAAFSDRIIQNSKLFARIDAVYAARDQLTLTPEEKRLLWLRDTRFVRAGAKLDDVAKSRLSELNQQLASHPKHRLAQLLQLQVRFDFIFVEVVLRLAHLLGVKMVVPRRDADAGSLAVRDRLHVLHFLVNPGDRRFPHRLHQGDGALGSLGHAVLELPVSMGWITQQLRPLRT